MIYKIVLDSYDTSSFTGTQFNATYYIDFNKFITNQEDFNKPYKLNVSITSISSYTSESGLTPSTNLYYYSVDFSKQLTRNATFNNTRHPISGVLRFENIADVYISSTTGADAVYQTKTNIKVDDGPFFINNLKNINNITFKVFKGSDNTIFSPADNTKSKYIVILTLEQVKY